MNEVRLKAPNLAVACCLVVPLLALVVNAIGAAGGTLSTGAAFFTSYYAIGCTIMSLPLAARIERAPEYAIAIVLFLLITGGILGHIAGLFIEVNPYDDQSHIVRSTLRRASRDILIFPVLGAFAALSRRDSYRVEFDKDAFPEHVVAGLRLLLRDDRGAPKRAALGMGCVAVGLVVMFLPLALGNPNSVSTVWLAIRGLLVAAIGLLSSSVVIRVEDEFFDA